MAGSDRKSALDLMKRHPLASVRLETYTKLRPLMDGFYTSAEMPAYRAALAEMLERVEASDADPSKAAKAWQDEGYTVLFKDDLLHVNPHSLSILKAFDFDGEEIRDIMAGDELLTAGDLLKEHKYEACFIRGKTAHTGAFLFSTSQAKMNRAQFWHEAFHAVQHRHGLYDRFKRDHSVFWIRELEASAFVIENARRLKIPRADLMLELRIWSMRLEELLEHKKQLRKPRFSGIA